MKINDLHIKGEPKLLFMANDIKNKGRSNKSYSIVIVNDQHNDELLSQLFSKKAKRVLSFECGYDIGNTQMRGTLKVSVVDKIYATGIFISGNGSLWNVLDGKNLKDYDFSELAIVLEPANLTESGNVIYDLCDRGQFLSDSDTKIDITERYPAIRIQKIIEMVLNQAGFGVTFESNLYNIDFENIYLLFTQDNAIRNSKDWLKQIIAKVYFDSSNSDTGSSVETTFSIAGTSTFDTVVTDTGGNVSGNTYVVPEMGTYRIIVNSSTELDTDAALRSYNLSIRILVNSLAVAERVISAPDIGVEILTPLNVPIKVDSFPIELQAGDILTFAFGVTGTLVAGASWTATMSHVADETNMIDVSGSQYYGAGSTIDMALLLPDLKVLDFISKVSNYINLYSFYREELKILAIEHGRQEKAVAASVTPIEPSESLEETKNFTLEFSTDMMQPPENIYVDNGGLQEDTLSFPFSRTFLSTCYRLFNDLTSIIPVLWKSGNPLIWNEPRPEYNTKANLRLLEFEGMKSGSFVQTFGGDKLVYQETKTTYPSFKELDIEAFHKYEMLAEGTEIEITARLDVSKLYDQTYFKNPLNVIGHGRFWLISAEIIKNDIYKLNLSR